MENTPGILTARLATEISCLETVTGVQLGTMLEAISLIVASLVIGFYYSWALALVNICFTPILIASSAVQVRLAVAFIFFWLGNTLFLHSAVNPLRYKQKPNRLEE